jgi:sec-independent protein translocase protein TatA
MFTGILQPTHLILILLVALVVLGPKRLPDAGRALGQGLNEFKNSIAGHRDDDKPPSPRIPASRDPQDAPPPDEQP